MPPQSDHLHNLALLIDKKTNDISFKSSQNVTASIPSTVICIGIWGRTYYVAANIDNVIKLIEYGSLSFAIELSKHLNAFYNAISYTPPHTPRCGSKTLQECIELATPLVRLLESIQRNSEETFPGRKSFYGMHGTVFSDTVACVKATVESWSSLLQRVNFFDPTSGDKIYPHTISNESLIERAFGFTKGKGQSELQSMQEYLHNKNKHEVDFQLKLCKTSFCQHIKTKLRDKGYQDVDSGTLELPLQQEDVWEILLSNNEKLLAESTDAAGEKILQQAFLLTKSVPCQSNRAKWKQDPGFAPSMLQEVEINGNLLEGDLVFCKDTFGTVKNLIVTKDHPLVNMEESVFVEDVESSVTNYIPISSLMTDKGMIVVVPVTLYEKRESSIHFNDIASQMVEDMLRSDNPMIYTDEEISQLMTDPDVNLLADISMETGPVNTISTSASPADEEDEDLLPPRKKACYQKILSSDDDDSDIGESNGSLLHSFKVGDWVVSAFIIKTRPNYYLGQVMDVVADNTSLFVFQYYRCISPNEHLYTKLLENRTTKTEVQDVDTIVETIHRDNIEIISGDKVKLVGPEMRFKLV